MIEIHSHILPGLDDGADGPEASLIMAKQALSQGIHTIIATPHHADGKFDNPCSAVALSVQQLNEQLRERGMPLEVLPGQEIRLNRNLFDDLEKGLAGTLNHSAYLLLELPSCEVPDYAKEYVHELLVMGYTPIIAHPERNRELARDPSKLLELIELGALSQITAMSVSGGHGQSLQNRCLELCRCHLAHFVASDAHHAISRPFGLKQAYDVLGERVGSDCVRMFQENADCVVRQAAIRPPAPTGTKRKKWYRLWK